MRFPQELERWEGRQVEEWRRAWNVPRLHVLEWTASTNDDVRALAQERAPELTCVIAERQTAGRGQHGRTWQGSPGKSLHFSALLRPTETPALTATSIRVGLAAACALASVIGMDIKLKWPNDLQLNGRKLGGILCESTTGRETFVVVGIGINVGQLATDFDEEIRDRATSLAMAGHAVSRAAVAGALAGALADITPRSALELAAEELNALIAIDALLGHEIEVDGVFAGVARGISALGALLVEQSGMTKAISGGTVRVKPDARADPVSTETNGKNGETN